MGVELHCYKRRLDKRRAGGMTESVIVNHVLSVKGLPSKLPRYRVNAAIEPKKM